MDSKKPWLSKTIWTNVILALVSFFPPVHDYLKANPETLVFIFSIANVILRLITKKEITWQD